MSSANVTVFHVTEASAFIKDYHGTGIQCTETYDDQGHRDDGL